jgi:hypothetical protein
LAKELGRAMQPFGKDADLFDALGDGSYALNGIRNADLQVKLFQKPAKSPEEKRSRAGKVMRLLRMLRAHGLIRKIQKTHRYHLTDKGRALVTALGTAKIANTKKLTELAA